jgi:hypothetical protein
MAPTRSAGAENPHSTPTNFACDLRFAADTCPQLGHLRLVFCGATATSRPLRHCVLYSSWRRNSNGLASKIERFSPDFCATFFVADLLMFLTCRSSITTTDRGFTARLVNNLNGAANCEKVSCGDGTSQNNAKGNDGRCGDCGRCVGAARSACCRRRAGRSGGWQVKYGSFCGPPPPRTESDTQCFAPNSLQSID